MPDDDPTPTQPIAKNDHDSLLILRTHFREFQKQCCERHQAILEGQQELKAIITGDTGLFARMRKVEQKQIYVSGFAAGAGLILAKAWDWLTGGK